MAEIPVERKSRGIPIWVWLLGAAALAALLLFLILGHRDDAAPVAAASDAGPVMAAAPTPKTCQDDNGCAASQLCLQGTCAPISSNSAACSTGTLHFTTASADLVDADKAGLDRMARCLRADQSMKLTIAGDADQRGPQGMNDDLASKRARAVSHQLTARGVSDKQLQVVSYGDHNLLCGESDEACWSKNRRVDTQLNK